MKSILILELLLILLLSLSGNEAGRAKRAIIGQRWPSNKIAYEISKDYDALSRLLIKNAISAFENALIVDDEKCLEFVDRQGHEEEYADYILIKNNGECSSGVGYFRGPNKISLGYMCLESGTIQHELMHRIGFDHEHSRYDRNDNVEILLNNTNSLVSGNNFDVSFQSNRNRSQDVPYDFFSVTHYNSDALTSNRNDFSILSKFPALVNDKNEIFYERNALSRLDILQIQRFYGCKEAKRPNIVRMQPFVDEAKVSKLRNRLNIETSFENVEKSIVDKYVQRTYKTCGMSHFWPSEYPLVDSDHELYAYVCEEKKKLGQRCRFSFDCEDEEAVCVRLLFKKSGNCFRTENQKINDLSQRVSDKLFKTGKKIKDKVKNSYKSVKNWFGKITSKQSDDE